MLLAPEIWSFFQIWSCRNKLWVGLHWSTHASCLFAGLLRLWRWRFMKLPQAGDSLETWWILGGVRSVERRALEQVGAISIWLCTSLRAYKSPSQAFRVEKSSWMFCDYILLLMLFQTHRMLFFCETQKEACLKNRFMLLTFLEVVFVSTCLTFWPHPKCRSLSVFCYKRKTGWQIIWNSEKVRVVSVGKSKLLLLCFSHTSTQGWGGAEEEGKGVKRDL